MYDLYQTCMIQFDGTESQETKRRTGSRPIPGPPFIPAQTESAVETRVLAEHYILLGSSFSSLSFVHISGCELQLPDLNLSPNKNVENYKATSGAGGWVQLTLTTQS